MDTGEWAKSRTIDSRPLSTTESELYSRGLCLPCGPPLPQLACWPLEEQTL